MPASRSGDVVTIGSRVRPKRAAFIVDPAKIDPDDLDDLCAKCGEHWGGGFWPVVPSDGNEIASDWWDLLRATDPDMVVHMPELGTALETRIHRHLAPSRVVHMRCNAVGRIADDGVHEINGLSSFGTLPYRTSRRLMREPVFAAIEDDYKPSSVRRFAVRNFGVFQTTPERKSILRSVSTETRKIDEFTQATLLDWLREFNTEVFVPRDLGVLAAPRFYRSAHDQPFSGFTLIVGDTSSEALLFWNRRLLSAGHLGRDSLWIDTAGARDPSTVDSIGRWIKRFFWNDRQQHSGAVVSYTEDGGFLDALAGSLSLVTGMYWKGTALSIGEFPCKLEAPSGEVFTEPSEQIARSVEQVFMSQNGSFDSPTGLLTVARPPFVPDHSRRDGWMLDLDIEYNIEPRRFANRSDRWRLPRSARLGSLFAKGRELARVERQHQPSVSVRAEEAVISVAVPDKEAVLRRLLDPLPVRSRIDARFGDVRARFKGIQPSTQGRRVQAIIDLFEGLSSAGRFFDDPYWRTMMFEAIGKPSDDIDRLAEVARREVLPMLKTISELPASDTIEERIARVGFEQACQRIATAINRAKAQPRRLTRSILGKRYSQLTAEVVNEGGRSRKRKFDDGPESELEWLLAIGVLLQGVGLSCTRCGTNQWREVGELSRSVECRDCKHSFEFPSAPEWEYRVNGLIADSIAKQGVLPVVHTLWQLTDGARATAIVFSPQELREDYDGPALTDLDVIAVRDGQFLIGEVKSNPARFDQRQISILAEVAKEVSPDSVVLAAPGKAWPVEVERLFDDLANSLADHDIKVEWHLLSW